MVSGRGGGATHQLHVLSVPRLSPSPLPESRSAFLADGEAKTSRQGLLVVLRFGLGKDCARESCLDFSSTLR